VSHSLVGGHQYFGEKKPLLFYYVTMEAAQSAGIYLPTYLPNHINSTGFEGKNNHRKLHQNNQSKAGFEPGVYHVLEIVKTLFNYIPQFVDIFQYLNSFLKKKTCCYFYFYAVIDEE